MRMVSEKTMEFLRERFEQCIEDWLDDPDEQFTSWTHAEFAEWIETMVTVGKDVERDFWTLLAESGTEYERNRVNKMLKKTGIKKEQPS